ncbi:MAG: TPM domain-containing protein [Clostridiales bacterium]|nr:TPM domain-containing protein [Clostridiales bacterium]
MVKKLLPLLLALLLLPVIALADAQVIDRANLFSGNEISQMSTIIDQIESKHQVDIVVLTTNDVPTDNSEEMWRVRDYADDFYDQGGYGMGKDHSGLLILLDIHNRVIWLSTGGVMIDYITDSREEAIIDAGYDDLRRGNYGQAIIASLFKVEHYMDKGRQEGTFRYDEATGERLSGMYNALTSGEMLFAAVAGVGAAVVLWLSVSGVYNLGGSTYSYDLNANSSVELTRDEEHFVRQYTTRTRRESSSSSSGGGSSGGSGVHRSSGGVSHGGGGRRF